MSFKLSSAFLIALGAFPAYSQNIDGGSIVTVPGSQSSPWNLGTSSLTIGNTSTGTLQIGAGGVVSSGSGFVGRQVGSTGNVTVNGIGAQWTAGPGLNIGNFGTGTLGISNGGHVTSTTNTYLGVAAGSSGTLTISGAGSQLNTTGFMRVGQTGTGTVQITNGAVVTNGLGYIGYDTTGVGTVTISGTGSQWNNSAELSVGTTGKGQLTISNGAAVSSTLGTIGAGANATGAVTIDGTGSSWTNSGVLTVGNAGSGALTISNNGTVSAVSARAGVTAGSQGVINIGAAALAAAAAPGTLTLTGPSPSLTLGATGGLVFNHTNTGGYVFAPGITGAGKLSTYSGTTILTAANNYTGGTTIAGGTLQLGNGSTSGAIVGNVANNGVLTFNRTDSVTFAGLISGSGVVNHNGTGTTILTANNTYTGGTTISAGTLQLGNGGTSGAIVGNVVNNGALVFNRSNILTLAGQISGSGSVSQVGAGTTVLTGNNTYTGTTTISAGTLQLGNGGTAGAILGDVTNNGELAFNRSDALAFPGLISGSGVVNQMGTGTTILTANNTYTGGTTISAGTLQLGSGGTGGAILGDVANNSTLAFNRSDIQTFAGQISGSGVVNQIGTGTTILTANNTYTGGTTISAGTLQLGNGGTGGAILGDVANNGTLAFNRSDLQTFPGLISGNGMVNQIGAGTTILTADNTYTGGTTISAGALQLGNGGTSGAILGDVANNGTFAFNRSDTVTFAGLISGSGTVNHIGAGTTMLTAQNTYGGPTNVNNGVLRAGAVSTLSPNSAMNVTAAGTLDLNGYSQTTAGVTNAGLINMGTGTAPGTTLTTPYYVGQGGKIAMNTLLGGDGSPSDRLVINGGAASGSSSLIVSNAGGAGALTAGNGILLVDAVNGGTTAANAFTLGNAGGYVAAGPYAYTLQRSGVDGSGLQNWYLRSTVDCATAPSNPACKDPEPPVPPNPPNPPEPPVPPNPPTPTPPAPPNYRPEVSTAVATPELALRYGSTFLDSLHERIGEARYALPSTPTGDSSLAWGRVIGVTGERNGSNSGILGSRGPDYDYKIYGLQSGVDLYRRANANGSMDHAGAYVAFGRATADVDHLDGRSAAQAAMNGVTLGGYWTHVGKEGWYVDAVIQGTRYDVDNGRSPAGYNLGTRGFGFATSLEGGYPFRLNDEWVIEPQAQLVFQNINLNDANDGAAKIRFSDVDSLRGRVGVRLARTVELDPGPQGKRIATTWLRASLVNEFLTNPTTEFSSQNGYVPFQADMKGASVQLNLGADVGVKRNVSVYAA
ncbi:autotransporter outer membrane beta-barrel domain-containing protein [Achromobacter insolitus]|uniref:autotransporter outer membrane beta-barrel domain-containing protein n=1 Tax=Achromobacter insolitus TaxID=217204 RepID=UPI00265AF2EB|nr:autotransporter outer membrane beta-barrel domain-containing protein [Achromobacter insolitus]WKK20035.1 autotransporter outer membrane beta-barrel domain-containing protein [Achromobacter insolitus]